MQVAIQVRGKPLYARNTCCSLMPLVVGGGATRASDHGVCRLALIVIECAKNRTSIMIRCVVGVL